MLLLGLGQGTPQGRVDFSEAAMNPLDTLGDSTTHPGVARVTISASVLLEVLQPPAQPRRGHHLVIISVSFVGTLVGGFVYASATSATRRERNGPDRLWRVADWFLDDPLHPPQALTTHRPERSRQGWGASDSTPRSTASTPPLETPPADDEVSP